MTARHFSPNDIAAAKAWPFEEARKLDARLKRIGHDGVVIFETGYGPSGPPHIGTFGEVARTTMVRRAFELMTGRKTRLISFLVRRHGRHAQISAADPESGHDAEISADAADVGAGSVGIAPVLCAS